MTEKTNSYKTTMEVTTSTGSTQPAAIAAYLNNRMHRSRGSAFLYKRALLAVMRSVLLIEHQE